MEGVCHCRCRYVYGFHISITAGMVVLINILVRVLIIDTFAYFSM